MSVQTVLLGMASVVLPRPHRARWREEASAVLMGVSGSRRLWYTLDTVVKVPILARQHRRGQPDGLPGRVMSAAVGAALLASAFAVFMPMLTKVRFVLPGGVVFALWEPLGYLLVMGGLAALVAVRSFRYARRDGGGLGYADSGAVLITAFVATGPLVAGPLSFALDLPVVALVGNVLPGVWLAVICAMALRRRTGPWPLAVVGAVAGLALIGVLGNLPLRQALPGHEPLALQIGHLSSAVALPAYLIWSGWAGARLLLGRQDLLMAWSPTPDGVRPDEAR
jgi:hypothetical protein